MAPRIFRNGLFVLVVAAGGAVFPGHAHAGQSAGVSRTPAAESRSQAFLIFPFENESRLVNLDWLSEGLSELTAERLEDKQITVLDRQDRLATLERMGLPDSGRFSHATIIKIATEADADAVVYGRFQSDGKTATLEARVLRLSPPSLSPPLVETGPMQDLVRADARLAWQILCAIDAKNCPAQGANRDESSFSEPPPSLRPDALENFVRAVAAPGDEERLRLLREAARLEPAWDRPSFELGQIYFDRHDCDQALVWLSRVAPGRPDGPEASFDAGVCHLQRNDAARAEAAFSGMLERTRSAGAKGAPPELPEMHNNLGIARLRLAKWTEAGAEFERATALDPEEADYWFNLGILKLATKQGPAAVSPLERASKIDPDDKEAKALLIATLESVGRSSDAAALRGDGAASAPKGAPLNLQDPGGLVKLARVSKNVDRALLRPGGEPPSGQTPAGQKTQKPAATGERR